MHNGAITMRQDSRSCTAPKFPLILERGVVSEWNGVNSFNVPIEAQHILSGVIIVANTALSQWRARAAG